MRFGTEAMLSEYEVHSRQPTDHLVNQHLPLVKRIASQLAVKLPSHIEIDDLIQVGLIGLLKAVDDYQNDSGAVFSTYATIRIRGAMLDELRVEIGCHAASSVTWVVSQLPSTGLNSA